MNGIGNILIVNEIEKTIEDMRRYKRDLIASRNDIQTYYKSQESIRFIIHMNRMISDCDKIMSKLNNFKSQTQNRRNGFSGGGGGGTF